MAVMADLHGRPPQVDVTKAIARSGGKLPKKM
jgi:hypothetical protein